MEQVAFPERERENNDGEVDEVGGAFSLRRNFY